MQKLTKVRITLPPKGSFDFDNLHGKVFATVDGKEKLIFPFFSDEISFTPEELEGLTESEARELLHKKDKAFLQS